MCQGLGPKKHDEISEIDRRSARFCSLCVSGLLCLCCCIVYVVVLFMGFCVVMFMLLYCVFVVLYTLLISADLLILCFFPQGLFSAL